MGAVVFDEARALRLIGIKVNAGLGAEGFFIFGFEFGRRRRREREGEGVGVGENY